MTFWMDHKTTFLSERDFIIVLKKLRNTLQMNNFRVPDPDASQDKFSPTMILVLSGTTSTKPSMELVMWQVAPKSNKYIVQSDGKYL